MLARGVFGNADALNPVAESPRSRWQMLQPPKIPMDWCEVSSDSCGRRNAAVTFRVDRRFSHQLN
jgi:hypothetical protein